MECLPQVIVYIVTGYVFSKTFHFVALKKNSNDIEHVLTLSLVIGYIYCKIASLIPIHISDEIDTLGIVISALIWGYLFARFVKNRYVIQILDFLKIRDTGNLFYWDDLLDNEYPMKVKVLCDDVCYEGMLHNFENYSNEPHIVLASYVVKDKSNKVLHNFVNDNTKIIVLDTSKVAKLEIIYAKDSNMCKDLKDMCDSNNELYNHDD